MADPHKYNNVTYRQIDLMKHTIESEPVKHAKWEMRDYYKKVDKFGTVHRIAEPSFTCTNCRSACSNPFKYCPRCGAKMDLED